MCLWWLPSSKTLTETAEVEKWHFMFPELRCPQRSGAASDVERCLASWFILRDTESFRGSLPNLSLSLQVPVWYFKLPISLERSLLPMLPYAKHIFVLIHHLESEPHTHTQSSTSHPIVEGTSTVYIQRQFILHLCPPSTPFPSCPPFVM